jgi:hypothetical protein
MWLNKGYNSFEDYLRTFRSNRRTKIKRELRSIQQQGIDIRMISAEEAPNSYYDIMYKLYIATWSKHMGLEIRPFLNRKFFELLRDNFRHRNSFCVATRSGDVIGMALFYHKNESLYGRYWGCFDEIPFLHFATCYYYPIRYAIHQGFKLMDPGFGGEHKLYRGYETIPAYHYIKFHGEKHRRTAHAILEKMQSHAMIKNDRI